MEILKGYLSNPLEREFESWVIQGIERYFKALGIDINVIAVSTKKEKEYP